MFQVHLLFWEGKLAGHKFSNPGFDRINYKWDAKRVHNPGSLFRCLFRQHGAVHSVPETERWCDRREICFYQSVKRRNSHMKVVWICFGMGKWRYGWCYRIVFFVVSHSVDIRAIVTKSSWSKSPIHYFLYEFSKFILFIFSIWLVKVESFQGNREGAYQSDIVIFHSSSCKPKD